MSNKEMSKLVHAAGTMLLALGLVFSQAACAAQSQNPKENAEPAGKTSAQQAPVKGSVSTPAQAESEESKNPAKQTTAGETASGGGPHEGIKVHGHWTIEVRNPDGTVVTHREFENALSPGVSFPVGGGLSMVAPGGEALLSALLTGQAETPAWVIFLEGADGLAATGTTGPCIISFFAGQDACVLAQNLPNSFFEILCGNSSETGLSCNLTANPLGIGPSFAGFQLSGSVVATQSGTVAAVATSAWGLCGKSGSLLPTCVFAASDNGAFLTARTLDGVGTDPNPVPVSAGQTLAVTVTISFSSGN
jgi:hypothetical protein